MDNIRVELGERSYNIVFGKEIEKLQPKKTLLITDSNVNALHREKLIKMVEPADVFVIPAGEESKNAGTFLDICRQSSSTRVAALDVSPEHNVARTVTEQYTPPKNVAKVFDCKGLSPETSSWDTLCSELSLRNDSASRNVLCVAKNLHHTVPLGKA